MMALSRADKVSSTRKLQRRRQTFLGLGCTHFLRRIADCRSLANQKAVERAQRRQPSLDAARREAARVQSGGIAAHAGIVENAPALDPPRFAKFHEGVQIAPVRIRCVPAHLTLMAQVRHESFDPGALLSA
jgi:hypothetical protein